MVHSHLVEATLEVLDPVALVQELQARGLKLMACNLLDLNVRYYRNLQIPTTQLLAGNSIFKNLDSRLRASIVFHGLFNMKIFNNHNPQITLVH